eukprot:Skav205464  [mRNA]  locus=scaffold4885:263184:268607:+ [translate_table: standard]
MENVQHGQRHDLLQLVKKFRLQPCYCSCHHDASYLIRVGEQVACTSAAITVKATIETELLTHRPDTFLGYRLTCSCNDKCQTTNVTVAFSLEQWESTLSGWDGLAILVGVKCSQGHLAADHDDAAVLRWCPLGHDNEDEPIRMGDMFCGGLGGWSHAAKALASEQRDILTCWAVDMDPLTAQTFRKSHDMTHVSVDANDCWSKISSDDRTCQSSTMVFKTNIKQLWWVTFAALKRAQIICASPPCPPWSLTNEAGGLSLQPGMCLVHAILILSILRPRIWLIENVSNLLSHAHWSVINSIIEWSGYVIKWKTSLNLAEQAPQNRDRALILAVDRTDMSRFEHSPLPWPAIDKPTLHSYGVLRELEDYWIVQTAMSPDILAMYLDPLLLPKAGRDKSAKRTKRDVVEYRLRGAHDTFGCILTTYGQPLSVKDDHLRKGGLYGTLFTEANLVRKLSVPELLALMGVLVDVWLPQEECAAVGMIGNCISPLHALIGIINALCFVRPMWIEQGVQSLFSQIAGKHIRSDQMICTAVDGGFWFTRMDSFGDDVPRTLPARAIHSLKITSPIQVFDLLVEAGINVKNLLQCIAGKSSPPQFSIPIKGTKDLRFLAPDNLVMPGSPLTVNAQTPCFLWPSEHNAVWSDWPFVLVLTPLASFILQRDEGLRPADIDMLINSCDDGTFTHGRCVDMFMRPCALDVECPNIVMYIAEQDTPDTLLPKSVKFTQHGLALKAVIHVDILADFIGHMKATRLLDVCHALGWNLVETISLETTMLPQQWHEVHLIKIEGRLAVQADHLVSILKVILFTRHMNLIPLPKARPVRLCIRIFDTWAWKGWIENDMLISRLDAAWGEACRFFDHEPDCRWICLGKRLCPEFRFCDYCPDDQIGGESFEFKVHLVMPLKGGGPSSDLPQGVREVVISEDDADDSPEAPAPVIPAYPGDLARPDVRDDVEQVVATYLERLVQYPSHDRFLTNGTYEGLVILEEQNQMVMHGSIREIIRVMEFCQRSGIETLLNDMGWQLVIRIPNFASPERMMLLFHPIAGARMESITTMRGFLVSAITYCRMPISGPHTGDAVHVRLNLWGVVLVDGFYDPSTATGRFSLPWFDASSFLGQPSHMRLISGGKQLNPDYPISQFARIEKDGVPTLKLHMVFQLSGGGPPGSRPKVDAIVKVKNELAKLLLDIGCELQTTSQAVDQLVKRAGNTPLNATIRKRDHAAKLEAIQQIAKDVGVTIPDHNHAALQRQQANFKRLSNLQQEPRPPPCASAYTLKKGFFRNEDGTECEILQSLQHSACGVFLCDASRADHWLECAGTISQDELALVILGGCKGTASGTCKPISIPATDSSNYPVVLSCCVHQLGRRAVKIQQPTGASVQVEESVICSLTLYRDELSEEDWENLQQHPTKVALECLHAAGVNTQIINSPWGRSWWGNAGKTAPASATSLQLHVRIPASAIVATLKASGMTGVYINPKNEKGNIDTKYAIVWADGGLHELQVKASAVAEALGLVRITRSKQQKTSRGIRVASEHFEKTFKQLRPNIAVPKHVQVEHIAKLTPIPDGASADSIKLWIDEMKLNARPIKPLGQKTWLLGFGEKIESSWFFWNDQMVMVQFLPDRAESKKNPVVVSAAPRAALKAQQESSMEVDSDDPWAAYRSAKGMDVTNDGKKSSQNGATASTATAARIIQGPIEQRFQDQDKSIANIQQAITALQKNVDEQGKNQMCFQQAVEEKFKVVQTDMDRSVEKLGKHFEESLNRAMQKQDSQLNSCFSELKQMMIDAKKTTRKRTGPPPGPRGGQAMEDDEAAQTDSL